jgi:hypothetical protein
MKDKRWDKIVNASYLWPLLLGGLARVPLHMGELTQDQLLI